MSSKRIQTDEGIKKIMQDMKEEINKDIEILENSQSEINRSKSQ
jgi:hypothetical protein